MKKIGYALLLVCLMIGLVACGSDKSSSNSSKTNSVEDVLAKVMEANKDIKSLSQEAKIQMQMSITQGEQIQEEKMDMTTKMDLINDPLTAYQEIQMSVPEQGEQTIKQYITKDGIFSNINGEWIAIPEEMNAEFKQTIKEAGNMDTQVEQFDTLSEYLKLKEESEQYVLTADIPGDKMKEIAQSVLQKASTGNEQTIQAMEQMDIKSIKLAYQIDKKTHLFKGVTVNMVMNMEAEGQKVEMKMDMDSTFSNINNVKEIIVPKEALTSSAQ